MFRMDLVHFLQTTFGRFIFVTTNTELKNLKKIILTNLQNLFASKILTASLEFFPSKLKYKDTNYLKKKLTSLSLAHPNKLAQSVNCPRCNKY